MFSSLVALPTHVSSAVKALVSLIICFGAAQDSRNTQKQIKHSKNNNQIDDRYHPSQADKQYRQRKIRHKNLYTASSITSFAGDKITLATHFTHTSILPS